jgi:hypothetical protein
MTTPRKQPTDAQILRIREVAAARAALPSIAALATETGLTTRQVQSIADGTRYKGRAVQISEVHLSVLPMAGVER